MKISVIMCTRDRPDMVRMSLESILSLPNRDFDVHVVDQSVGPETRDTVAQLALRFPETRVVCHYQEIAGAARARNRGLAASDGEIVAFVDDDIVVDADWLDVLTRVFADDPDVGLVYGQVRVARSLQDAARGGMIVPSLVWSERSSIGLPGRFRLWGMSANMAARRSLLAQLGGFDETLGVGGVCRAGEDFDFSYRAYLTGARILLEPDLQVEHYGMRTPEQWPVTLQNYGFGDGCFFMKHLRCRDTRIVGVLLRHAGLIWARGIKAGLRARRWEPNPYVTHLVKGMRFSFTMGIDDRRRYVYRGEPVSTEANPITQAR